MLSLRIVVIAFEYSKHIPMVSVGADGLILSDVCFQDIAFTQPAGKEGHLISPVLALGWVVAFTMDMMMVVPEVIHKRSVDTGKHA